MKIINRLRSSMAANIIGSILLLLVLFGLISSAIGFISFTNAYKRESSETTYHMADTASTLVNGDHLDDYLAGELTEEYELTADYLDKCCHRMGVSLIYVIVVDRSDYGRFVSVFNAVDNTVDDTSYTEWELGHERDTTNDEYRLKYRAIYEEKSAFETVYRVKMTDGQHPHITTLVPVKGSDSEVTAILCMQRPMRELYDARRPFLINIAVSAVILAILSSVLAALYIRRLFVAPITKVSDEAARFARENTIGSPLGSISRFAELSDLSLSIDKMEKDMVKYIDNLTEAATERERINTELNLARNIQKNSVPNKFPAFAGRHDFDIFASMSPAREVGGDFYNFILVDNDHLAMIIGDVSGKGVPAALFMMVTNILTTERTRIGQSPAETLTFVNRILNENNRLDMFVTIWLGILELSTGKLTAANAGHEYPVIRHKNGQFEILKDKHGLVVGGMADTVYSEYELTLEPGSKLFVYTDGVPEATDSDNNMFGEDRMLCALNVDPNAPAETILKNVRDEVDSFVKGAEQFDDLTMLCVEYKGPTGGTENEQ
ncbi:MAG: PP2C family protein-serine/threonine phosphatase [Lachnospiraceae bacterium]|nr:PP2C family protein-serine/threonine phosphatase [Lachnospiraceae bacterium]